MTAKALDAAEALTSTVAGFLVSLALTYWALPMWGLTPSLSASVGITALYTAASIARGYAVRRVFRRLAA